MLRLGDFLSRRLLGPLVRALGAWDGRPVFAYGFEDLTGAGTQGLGFFTGLVEAAFA